MASFADEFERIIEDTDRSLCDSYLASVGSNHPTGGFQIRFPHTREGKLRVSEQEARFVLTSRLGRSQLLYSVETPTSMLYQFTGKSGQSFTGASGQSARVDVTVYTPSTEAMWDFEFKAHGFSEDRKKKLSIQKDIEKFLREPRPAFWFHTLGGVDNSTLVTVWRAFLGDIREVAKQLSVEQLVPKTLVFHACVLRQRFSVEQRISIDPINWQAGVVPDIPGPTYVVTGRGLPTFEERDGWRFRRYETK